MHGLLQVRSLTFNLGYWFCLIVTKFKANNRNILCFNKDHGCLLTFCPTNRLYFLLGSQHTCALEGTFSWLVVRAPFHFFLWESRKAAAWREHCYCSFKLAHLKQEICCESKTLAQFWNKHLARVLQSFIDLLSAAVQVVSLKDGVNDKCVHL